MARIEDEIGKIADPVLRATLFDEVKKLKTEKRFGLVFEEHLPELVPVFSAKVKARSLVARRGRTFTETFKVVRVHEGMAEVEKSDGIRENIPADELTVVRRFGEPIYPALRSFDRVRNGDTSQPHHILIEADNYHALQLLEYCYSGKVDCIYIDPPYNSGARDWKYNNNYVDGNDTWRHSKWLSMMNKRLLLARRLLNPADSVLIVTIDEKEYLRLGLLLEQVFPEATVQMVSSVINPSGAKRDDIFSRTDEYIFFVTLGSAKVTHPHGDGVQKEVRWWYLRRTDVTSKRGTKKGGTSQFYPIYVNIKTSRIVRLGKALRPEDDHLKAAIVEGAVAVFPIREDGLHMNWGLTAPSLQRLLDKGLVRVTAGHEQQPYIFTYISESSIKKISDGTWVVTGERADGSKIVESAEGKVTRATTQWQIPSHDAGQYGTQTLRVMLGDRRFPFPKSLYAVEDALQFFVKEKHEALILDFFSGSGTTAHAVMRLNKQDSGKRQCISVTNNEVSSDEQTALREQGLHPGDPEWEKWGICRYITKPRLEAAITGMTPDGELINGDYKFTEEFPMSDGFPANLEYFKLDFLDPTEVQMGRQFAAILPVLWMMAGARCPLPDAPDLHAPWLITADCPFAVLIQEKRFKEFHRHIKGRDDLTHVFIVTNSSSTYHNLREEIEGPHVVQLYRDYLQNFKINYGKD